MRNSYIYRILVDNTTATNGYAFKELQMCGITHLNTNHNASIINMYRIWERVKYGRLLVSGITGVHLLLCGH